MSAPTPADVRPHYYSTRRGFVAPLRLALSRPAPRPAAEPVAPVFIRRSTVDGPEAYAERARTLYEHALAALVAEVEPDDRHTRRLAVSRMAPFLVALSSDAFPASFSGRTEACSDLRATVAVAWIEESR